MQLFQTTLLAAVAAAWLVGSAVFAAPGAGANTLAKLLGGANIQHFGGSAS